MRTNIRFSLAGVLLAACVVQAEQADRTKPMEISSNNGCMMDQVKGVSTCEGNVLIIQGTLRLNAEKVVVTQDQRGNQTLLATGRIVTFRQKMDSKHAWVEGHSTCLNYSSGTNLLVLQGNAVVKEGGNLVMGDVITYNTRSEIYHVTGGIGTGQNKGRVTVILHPKTAASLPSTPNPNSEIIK